MSAGYRPCACPDCFEITIGDMCHYCKTAGCDGEGECDSPYAYGRGFCDTGECDIVTGACTCHKVHVTRDMLPVATRRAASYSEALRPFVMQPDAHLLAHADGGYPVFYVAHELYTEARHADIVLCADCASDAYQSSKGVTMVDVNYEDRSLFCDDCGERIPSAYREDPCETCEGAASTTNGDACEACDGTGLS